MEPEQSDIERAYAVYSRRSLPFYDRIVPGFLNEKVWNCPTSDLLYHYRSHISTNHLEAGVGSGYFLARVVPEGDVRLALLDANRDCLDYAASRFETYRPELHQENLMEPFELAGAEFDSIGLNYVLHCLPGNLEDKAGRVLDHLAPLMHEKGTIFGSSILGTNVEISKLGQFVMKKFNQKGIFSNGNDSLGAMMEALSSRFKTFNVEVQGCVVLFSAKGLRDGFQRRLKGLEE